MADIDSPLDQQERYIAYGSGVYFVIVVALIILTANLQSSIQQQVGNILTADLYKDILAVASVTAVSFAIGYFIKYLGIHKHADNLFFRFENQLNNYIKLSLKKKSCECNIEIKAVRLYELLDVFFEFINKQEPPSHSIQRALYFSYSTKYGLSINLIVLSLLGFALTLGINLYNNNYGIYAVIAYGFFAIIGTLAYLVSQLKIRREILNEITRRQIYRIVYDESSSLKTMLQNRFGSSTASTPVQHQLVKPKDQDDSKYSPKVILQDASLKSSRIVTIIGPLAIISGILLLLVGTSEGLVAPIFSDILREMDQTAQSAEWFSRDESKTFLGIGFVLLIIGLIINWKKDFIIKRRHA